MTSQDKNILLMIEGLKDILKNSESQFMNKSTVVGFLGELCVKQQLNAEGGLFVHRGNQSGVDLVNEKLKIKIDVKTSTIKDFDKPYPNWGWALLSKSKPTATHYICVALDINFDVDAYYIIHSEDLELFPSPNDKRFKNLKYVLNIKKYDDTLLDLSQYNQCVNLLKAGKVIKVSSEKRLLDLL